MEEDDEREVSFPMSSYPVLAEALGEPAFQELVTLIADVAGAFMGIEVTREVTESPDSN